MVNLSLCAQVYWQPENLKLHPVMRAKAVTAARLMHKTRIERRIVPPPRKRDKILKTIILTDCDVRVLISPRQNTRHLSQPRVSFYQHYVNKIIFYRVPCHIHSASKSNHFLYKIISHRISCHSSLAFEIIVPVTLSFHNTSAPRPPGQRSLPDCM